MAQQTNESGGGDAQLAPPPVQESINHNKRKEPKENLVGEKGKFLGFSSCGFQITGSINISAAQRKDMFYALCKFNASFAETSPCALTCVWRGGEENKRGNLNKYE
jgi:hypothetical protein